MSTNNSMSGADDSKASKQEESLQENDDSKTSKQEKSLLESFKDIQGYMKGNMGRDES